MLKSSQSLPKKPIKTKQDDKEYFSSRRLTKEISMTNTSLEVYYGGSSVAVPFGWESQPGTPKVRFCENPLPPLTPPPSFHSNSVKKPVIKHSKSSLLHTVLPKLTVRKTQVPHSPASSSSGSSSSSSSSPWSSSHSAPSSPFMPTDLRGHLRDSSLRSLFDSRIHEEDDYDSHVSTLCFGKGRGANTRSRGCSPTIVKVLLRNFA